MSIHDTLDDIREIWDANKHINDLDRSGVPGQAYRHIPSHRRPRDYSVRRIILLVVVAGATATGITTDITQVPDDMPAAVVAADRPANVLLEGTYGEITRAMDKLVEERTNVRATRASKRADIPKPKPPTSTSKVEKVIAYALAQQGDPYVWASAGPRSFDCSGLTLAAYKQVGVSLPHYTGAILGKGKRINKSDLKRGDLVFPQSGHVGIYLGGGKMVHASSGKGKVVVAKMYSFWTARRIL